MKIYVVFISIMLISLETCEKCTQDICEEAKAPEINFGLLLSGRITVFTVEDNKEIDITDEYKHFSIDVFKTYCTGEERGPFTTNFDIGQEGTLINQSIGYMSYRMDNTYDYMYMKFIIGNVLIKNGFCSIYYDDLKLQNNDMAGVIFILRIEKSTGNQGEEYILSKISYTIN